MYSLFTSDTGKFFCMVEKKAEEVRLSLIENFPFLPLKIIDIVINETTYIVLSSCQVIRFEFDNFYEIALKKIKQRKDEVIEMLILNQNQLIDNRSEEKITDIINGLKLVLKSTQTLKLNFYHKYDKNLLQPKYLVKKKIFFYIHFI